MPVRKSHLQIVRCVRKTSHARGRARLCSKQKRGIMATVHVVEYPFMCVDFRNQQRHVSFGIRYGTDSGRPEM